MNVERDRLGFTERGWLEFGFRNYYTLLNCGFRLRPTAGTASGVHPVPLGFGRVYVHCPDGFSYDAWLKGLAAGRSFVTTGPMLFVHVNDRPPGHTFAQADGPRDYRVTGTAIGGRPLTAIEIVVNGEVARRVKPLNRSSDGLNHETPIDERLTIDGSSWMAVRCFESHEGRVRFAHGSPVFVDVPGKPLRPSKAEVEYLIRRVDDQLTRSKDVLPPEALKEYERAAAAYRDLAAPSR